MIHFDNSYARLPEGFFTRTAPTPVRDPKLIALNRPLALRLGLDPDWLAGPDGLQMLAGNALPEGAEPIAQAYAGHQFGGFSPQLGDGRAILLGEVVAPDGARFDIQLKGSGPTPFSRRGDGRAWLGPVMREYLVSEFMAAFGVPTTRALAIVGSDAPVRRETIETAAVVTRLAPSFIRFGHFEHFAAREDHAALRELADFVIDRFYPACRDAGGNPYQALLREVSLRTADMVAHWQAVGFCHGVMNTDNMSILGLTIDYGPFGFLDAFDANHICNHSDQQGRYAYSQQPQVAFWNLHCLAQALLPLWRDTDAADAADPEAAKEAAKEAAVAAAREALDPFRDRYAAAFFRHYRAKLGLRPLGGQENEDEALLTNLFRVLHANRVDYTLFWRNLARISGKDANADAPVRDLFLDRAAWDAWAAEYRARLQAEQSDDATRAAGMLAVNPKYILRNHLAETAIRAARDKDFSEVDRLLAVLSRPFDEQPESEAYAALPPDWASGLEVSCSS